MEKTALKIGGIIFVLVAVLHTVRVVMMLPVMIGSIYVPLRVSIVGAVVALAFGVWMLKLACGGCKK